MPRKFWNGTKEVNIIPKHLVDGEFKPIVPGYNAGDFLPIENSEPIYRTLFEKKAVLPVHDSGVQSIALDRDGNIYTATVNRRLRKFDSNGEMVWEVQRHSASINKILVMPDNSLVTCGDDGFIIQTLPNGDLGWSVNPHQGWIYTIALDNQGNLISGGQDRKLIKMDSNGNEIWSNEDNAASIRSIVIDDANNIYCGGEDMVLRKYSSSGALLESTNVGSLIRSLSINVTTNRVFAVTASRFVYEYNINLEKRNEFNFFGFDFSMIKVVDQHLYMGMNNGKIHKFSLAGMDAGVIHKHSNIVRDIIVTPDFIYTASIDGGVFKLSNELFLIGYRVTRPPIDA